MKHIVLRLVAIAVIAVLAGCSLTTRVEVDTYKVSERDTTTMSFIQNAPGNRDNGLVFPSTRNFKHWRFLVQRDSIIERQYPDFIRLGLFESVGFFVGGDKDYSKAAGMFGLFQEFDQNWTQDRGIAGKSIVGGLWRFGIGEWRLRWFRDAGGWTIGSSLLEVIAPDARIEKQLASIAPIYLRKRFYLYDKIPYVSATLAFGVGYYPSQYVNVSASLDAGSIGGLNFRVYGGLAAGVNSSASFLVKESPDEEARRTSHTSVFPYVGVGTSLLDFVNLVPEMYTEWSEHEHSAWNIGFLQAAVIKSFGTEYTAFGELDSATNMGKDEATLFSGGLLKLCNVSLAIPILNNRFSVGTSLLSVVVLGANEYGIGVLPARIGYHQTIIADELSTEPFFEYNYYPSSFFHIGNRVSLRITDYLNLGLLIGYVSGKTEQTMGLEISQTIGAPMEFSRAYVGISLGLADRIFFPEELRYNRYKKTQYEVRK